MIIIIQGNLGCGMSLKMTVLAEYYRKNGYTIYDEKIY